MKNGKILAGREAAAVFGIQISDVALNSIYRAMSKAQNPQYEVDDFVEYYEGMGEMGFGYIRELTERGFEIEPVIGGKSRGYRRSVSFNDMRGGSTLEKAAEYDRIRGGGS